MAGMDPKILAAVFASIAAIAVGTGGSGNLDSFQNLNPQDMIGEFTNSPSDILGDLNNLDARPVPNNSVLIEARLNSDEARFSVNADSLHLQDFSQIITSTRNISSDEAITFRDFSGDISFSREDMTSFDGDVTGFSSSGVEISERTSFTGGTDAEEIKIENVSRQAVNLGDVDAKISSREDSTVIERDDTSLKVNSFSGDIVFYKINSSLVMDGEVDKVEAGGTSYTG